MGNEESNNIRIVKLNINSKGEGLITINNEDVKHLISNITVEYSGNNTSVLVKYKDDKSKEEFNKLIDKNYNILSNESIRYEIDYSDNIPIEQTNKQLNNKLNKKITK